ncbi:hypothetical protein DFP72DRAFT_1060778 [Ephemerocybe angulata]|uniref:Uncharacterized protein n=1 Tax=Ephemerocybe angulata TaxID=980116 RepID=A0A8H6MB03_9AGAR|nr:hypothetical protein DFP72DRAFT_1060775 [Tulosesus angulatus]KAF6762528.1 hypothetical protein DFP72DRAFT_1060778 [Tulosesus angulatus]
MSIPNSVPSTPIPPNNPFQSNARINSGIAVHQYLNAPPGYSGMHSGYGLMTPYQSVASSSSSGSLGGMVQQPYIAPSPSQQSIPGGHHSQYQAPPGIHGSKLGTESVWQEFVAINQHVVTLEHQVNGLVHQNMWQHEEITRLEQLQNKVFGNMDAFISAIDDRVRAAVEDALAKASDEEEEEEESDASSGEDDEESCNSQSPTCSRGLHVDWLQSTGLPLDCGCFVDSDQ